MTITELREIAQTSGIGHAEFCLEQYSKTIDRDAVEPLWIEMANLVVDHAAANDGLE